MTSGYGIHETEAHSVLTLARVIGVKAAAAHYNIGVSTIYEWRKQYEYRADSRSTGGAAVHGAKGASAADSAGGVP